MSISGAIRSGYPFYTSSNKGYAKKNNGENEFDFASPVDADTPDVNENSKIPTMTAGDFFKQELRVTEESLRRMEETRLKKQQDVLQSISGLYKYAGIDANVPQKYEDITETDYALYRLGLQINAELGYQTLVGIHPNTMYDMNDQPIGFSHMDKNAFSMALMKEKLEALYSEDGINRTIGLLNLPNSVDKELLFKTMKSIGMEQISLLDKNIDTAIESIISLDAAKVSEIVMPNRSDSESEQLVESLKNSFREMIRESMSCASNIIRKDGIDDYSKLTSQYSNETSKVTFNIGGTTYTRKEFEDGYKQILLGNPNRFISSK